MSLKLFILHPAPGRKDGACGIKHVLGTAKGDFVVPEDFDAPLPDQVLAEFHE